MTVHSLSLWETCTNELSQPLTMAFSRILAEIRGDESSLRESTCCALVFSLTKELIKIQLDKCPLPDEISVTQPLPVEVSALSMHSIPLHYWAARLGFNEYNSTLPENPEIKYIKCLCQDSAVTLSIAFTYS